MKSEIYNLQSLLHCPVKPASRYIEAALKSTWLSVALFLVWAGMVAVRARSLLAHFSWGELGWIVTNATIAILFLVRSRPSTVSLNPLHWAVALGTSFSGMFFQRMTDDGARHAVAGYAIIAAGLGVSLFAMMSLGRNYDVIPALRGVATRGAYAVVRHPMYVGSILFRSGYVIKDPTGFNIALLLVLVFLYDLRVDFEERILHADPGYQAYRSRVRRRFVPGVY